MKLGKFIFEDKTLLYCIIITVIVFSLIHLYIINSKHNSKNNSETNSETDSKYNIENFNTAVIIKNNQDLNNYTATVDSLKNVIVRYNSTGGNKKNTLEEIINGMTNNINTAIASQINNLGTTITNNNLVPIQNTINANAELIRGLDTKLNKTILDLNSNISLAYPAYSVIAYNQRIAPQGWQICDGNLLKYANNLSTRIYTPDLRGRFILGTGTGDTNAKLSERKLGENGGGETHILNIEEMASHEHQLQLNNDWFAGGGDTQEAIDGDAAPGSKMYPGISGMCKSGGNSNGSTEPHNNIPPYYILTYIIKQPYPQ